MSKGKRNVAFVNDEDDEIEFIPKENTVRDKDPQPREIVIEPVDMRGSARQEALQSELNDFAKESPETVAAIIKSLFREEG